MWHLCDPMTTTIHLKPGKERPLTGLHPWVFSGAVAKVDDPLDGGVADVISAKGDWLGRGYYNSKSQIVVRVLTWDRTEMVDAAMFDRKIAAALEMRRRAGFSFAADASTTAFRLVNSESDFLPGVVADYYGGIIVVQFTTLGAEMHKAAIVDALAAHIKPCAILERSDAESREREGLAPAGGLLLGELPDGAVQIRENGATFVVDLHHGHKTGFYLDQRDNRAIMARLLAGAGAAAVVLNGFSYTGAFGVHACLANPGIRVINLDDSQPALDVARRNCDMNGCTDRSEFVKGNAFEQLRRYRDAGRSFDAVILDPPNFAVSQGKIPGALRGYKDINLLGIKLVKPGGILATFCCSGLIDWQTFRWSVFSALHDAGRSGQVMTSTGHPADHPWLLNHPEGEYLKGLFVRV
jgi:23S rRNA (cytosine1962-C5)-methyltransferase